MVDITITQQGERQIVKFSGELTTEACQEAVQALAPLQDQDSFDVELDFTDLTYISSSGLRLLLAIYKHQQTIGRRSIVSHLSDHISEVLFMGGFMSLFEKE